MNFILGILAVVGLYFFLNFFGSLHTSMIGTISGYAISWFQVLFFGGLAIIAKVTLSD